MSALGRSQTTERAARWVILGILLTGMLANRTFGQEAKANWPEAPQYSSQETLNTQYRNGGSDFEEPHQHAWDYTFAATTTLYIAADMYDVRYSEKAYRAGYVESNTFLVCGDGAGVLCRPKASSLYTRDAVEYALAAAPSLLMRYVFHRKELAWGFLSAPAVVIVKHVQGGDQARALQ